MFGGAREWRFELFNAIVRWTIAQCGLDRIDTFIYRISTLRHEKPLLSTDKRGFFELSVPCGTISTPVVREATLRIVMCLRAWVAHLTSLLHRSNFTML